MSELTGAFGDIEDIPPEPKSQRPAPKWWAVARAEGRLCRMCGEPVGKHAWMTKILDHLCYECYFRERDLPHSHHWRLGHG